MAGLQTFFGLAEEENAQADRGFSGRSWQQLKSDFIRSTGDLGSVDDMLKMQAAWGQMEKQKITGHLKSAVALSQVGNMDQAARELEKVGVYLSPGVRGRVTPVQGKGFAVQNFDADTGQPMGGYALTPESIMEIALAYEDMDAYSSYVLSKRATNASIRREDEKARAQIARDLSAVDLNKERALKASIEAASAALQLRVNEATADARVDQAYSEADKARSEARSAIQTEEQTFLDRVDENAAGVVDMMMPEMGLTAEQRTELIQGGFVEIPEGRDLGLNEAFFEPITVEGEATAQYRLKPQVVSLTIDFAQAFMSGNDLWEDRGDKASDVGIQAAVADVLFNDASFNFNEGDATTPPTISINGDFFALRPQDMARLRPILMSKRATYLEGLGLTPEQVQQQMFRDGSGFKHVQGGPATAAPTTTVRPQGRSGSEPEGPATAIPAPPPESPSEAPLGLPSQRGLPTGWERMRQSLQDVGEWWREGSAETSARVDARRREAEALAEERGYRGIPDIWAR